MNKLQARIKEFIDVSHNLGGDAESTNLTDNQVIELRNDLEKWRNNNRIFLWITVVMVLLLFLLSAYIVIRFIDNPQKLQLVLGASGISIMGLITYMSKLWKDGTSIDILISLVSKLDKQSLNTVLTVLLTKL